jgi:hypothetical protein
MEMDTKSYIEVLEKFQFEHKKLKISMQFEIDTILLELDNIFDSDKEFLEVGFPFIRSMQKIAYSYGVLVNIDHYFMKYEGPDIQYVKEALFVLSKIWFTSIVVLKREVEFGVPETDIDKISKILVKFLNDTETDIETLSYNELLEIT